MGKQYLMRIEENNCQLRYRIRWTFRKTYGFSKSFVITGL
ncbi:MAG: IS1 family transposase [Treponema sp.]|nr:IS1 family transposase [Treponema sp.]